MAALFWLAVGLVLYTFVGYGALMGLWARWRPRRTPPLPTDFTPPVALIIPAYNEAAVIPAKLANCRALDYPHDRLRLVFVTDGSTDGTPELLAAQADVTVLHDPQRQGKPAAMNRAAAFVQQTLACPILVFSDANAMLNPAAIRHLARHFADPAVGCVAGEKRVRAADADQAAGAGESLYWRYESTVKRWEAQVGSVMGAAGELFAVRADCYLPIPPDAGVDDFELSFRIAMMGKRLAYAPDAYALEAGSANSAEEWKRKVRIAAGGVQAMRRLLPLLNPLRYGLLSFQYISHRVLRWSVTPLALLLLIPLNGWLAYTRGGVYMWLAAGQVLFYAAAGVGYLLEARRLRWKPVFVPYYFTLMNLAVLAGWVRYLRGGQDVRWEKARRAT
jgi:cellulose synthase/poly-beta-1,6-N-acetylglucosamine synthase-like glycosyltransferase